MRLTSEHSNYIACWLHVNWAQKQALVILRATEHPPDNALQRTIVCVIHLQRVNNGQSTDLQDAMDLARTELDVVQLTMVTMRLEAAAMHLPWSSRTKPAGGLGMPPPARVPPANLPSPSSSSS
jgi:hypothetical protein